ncbi:MAG: flagellin [Burkholderiales bacterium]|jgi:flagellin
MLRLAPVGSFGSARAVDAAQRELVTAVRRLSSGLRVNSAADDAAGLAISERMLAQLRGNRVAERNAWDGVSLLQTADGALGRVTDMLQRLRELAVQAANGTWTASDLASLSAESKGLINEIDRIGKAAAFNGQLLLDGSFRSLQLQVGANVDQTIRMGPLLDVRAASLPTDGVAFSVNQGIDTRSTLPDGSPGAMPVAGLTPIAAGALTVSDADGQPVALGAIAQATSGAQRLSQVVAAINTKSGQTGISASISRGSGPGIVTVTFASDRAFSDADFGGFSPDTTGIGSVAPGPLLADPIGSSTLSSLSDAVAAINRYDRAIDQVSASRATVGAMQSRLEAAIAQLQVTQEAQSASVSRILDADMAVESARLSRQQVLQQAGLAMIAQANATDRLVLGLLRE